MKAIDSVKTEGLIGKVIYDEMPESPREWDNIGNIITTNNRYFNSNEGDYSLEDCSNDHEDLAIVMPVYMYVHSGVALSLKPFSCAWDSGKVGFIYVTKDKLKNEEMTIEKATEILEYEIENMNKFLCGEVYAYIIEDHEGNHIDSCYGFYDESGNVLEELKQAMEYFEPKLEYSI